MPLFPARLRLIATCFVLLAWAGGAHAADSAGNAGPDIRIRLVPVRSAVLSAQLAGQISDLPLREGDSFNAGQKLVGFDCGVEKARLAHASAQESATRRIYEVKSKLNNLNSIGSLELATAGADHAVAEADLQLAQQIASHCVISAPFAGRMGPVDVKRFQYVAEGQKLLEVIDPNQLEAEMLVPSSWSKWLKPGQAVDMGIEETGLRYQGKVSRISPEIDPVSQSIHIFVAIDGKHAELLPGMSGRASLAPPQ